jgi:Spy/CpxP family protein refolding chaperone
MRKAVLAIFLASVVATSLFAGGQGNGPDTANMVAHQIKYLTTMLDLTADQQNQLTTAFTNAANTNKPLYVALRAGHKQFDADKESNPGSLGADADAIAKAESQLMVNHANTDRQVKGILSASQYTKYGALHGHGGWRGGHHGHGGPGAPGGPGPGGPQ